MATTKKKVNGKEEKAKAGAPPEVKEIKGRYKKGQPGGPGRGKKGPAKELAFSGTDLCEEWLSEHVVEAYTVVALELMPQPLEVSKSLEANCAFRLWALRRAKTDLVFRAGLMERCKRDLLFFINLFVWQYNPNPLAGVEVIGPFLTWECQESVFADILDVIEKREDFCIEKSREMGASWMFLIVILWMFLFTPWSKFLVVSRVAEAVDKAEDPDCLFWKLDFMIDRLPYWMVGRDEKGKMAAVGRRKMGFHNPLNGSTITGQAPTAGAGVGGRCTAMFVDEFSRIREDFEILDGTADTTKCRLFNFTHWGLDAAAFKIANPVKGEEPVRKRVLHWSMHPEKAKGLYRWIPEENRTEILDKTYKFAPDYKFVEDGTPAGPFPGVRSPWYDAECRRRKDSRAIAMHLDIDAKGALSQFFQVDVIRALKARTRPPDWEGDLKYNRDSGIPDMLVNRKGGLIRLWCTVDALGKPPHDIYGAGVDCAVGEGATPSCLSMASATTGKKVLEYANPRIRPREFGILGAALCRLFFNAKIAWENIGPGVTFGAVCVEECNYRNVHCKTDETMYGDPQPDWDHPGWSPMGGAKLILLEEYRNALYTGEFTNLSFAALDETLAFHYTLKGTVAHSGEKSAHDVTGARENHGDLVMSDALAYKMIKDHGKMMKAMPTVQAGSLAWRQRLHEADEAANERVAWE